jgi:hypothetical protein
MVEGTTKKYNLINNSLTLTFAFKCSLSIT